MQADDSPLSDSSDPLSDAAYTLRSNFLEGQAIQTGLQRIAGTLYHCAGFRIRDIYNDRRKII